MDAAHVKRGCIVSAFCSDTLRLFCPTQVYFKTKFPEYIHVLSSLVFLVSLPKSVSWVSTSWFSTSVLSCPSSHWPPDGKQTAPSRAWEKCHLCRMVRCLGACLSRAGARDRSHVSCCASERAAAADAAHLQVNVFWEGLCQWAGEQSRPIRAEQIKRRFYSRSDSLWRVTCKRQSSLLWEQFSFWYFSQPKNMNNVCILKISDIFQKIVSHVSCFTSVNSNIHILTF